MTTLFKDRAAAGRLLASHLQAYAGCEDVVVLALTCGGVPVAWEVAQALDAVWDVLVVQKVAAAQKPHVVVGAIASGGATYIDLQTLAKSGMSPQQLEGRIATETLELARSEAHFRGTRKVTSTEGCTVIVVDDGVATGASMCAALLALRSGKPAWIVVAVPVAPQCAQERIGTAADEFVCTWTPPNFLSVGHYYRNFEPVGDAQVRALLIAS